MKYLLTCIATIFLATATHAVEPIKIGEMFSYSSIPNYADDHKNGYLMALEEINNSGGVLGRPLEIISRDVKGEPAEGVKVVEELINRENIDLLMGVCFDHVALAVGNSAAHNKIPYIKTCGGSDALIWQKGNHYTFRVGWTNTVSMAVMAEHAAKLPAKTWVTIASNYEFGRNVVASFKEQLKKRRPDVEFIQEHWPDVGKLHGSAVVQAIRKAKPDAILNMLFTRDLSVFIREGNVRDLFDGKVVYGNFLGEPETLRMLGAETPEGWYGTGFPLDQTQYPKLNTWAKKYESKFGDVPGWLALETYMAVYFIKDAIEKAGTVETEAFISSLEGLAINTPIGEVTMRAIDHNTNAGYFFGQTTVKDGKGKFVDYDWVDADPYFPADAEIIKLMAKDK